MYEFTSGTLILFHANTTLLITVALKWVLKLPSAKPPILFFYKILASESLAISNELEYWLSNSIKGHWNLKKKFCFIFLAALGLRCSVQGFLWLLSAGTALHYGAQALGSQASALAPWGLISWGSWAVSSGSAGSVVMAQGLTCSVLCMWNPPGSGTEPVSPALADGSYPLDHQGSCHCNSDRACAGSVDHFE